MICSLRYTAVERGAITKCSPSCVERFHRGQVACVVAAQKAKAAICFTIPLYTGCWAGVSQERLGPQVLPRDWEVGKRREVRNELALPIERLLEATIIVRTLQARQRVEHG